MNEASVQYTRGDDGVSLAFETTGDGPTALVLHPVALTNMVELWKLPSFRIAYALIAQSMRLILFDPRATGLSGRTTDLGTDAFVRDIGTVLTTVSPKPAAIIGFRQPWRAVRFAVAHPELVSSLVLVSPEFDPTRRVSVLQALDEMLPGEAAERTRRLINPSVRAEDEDALVAAVNENTRSWERLGVRPEMAGLHFERVEALLPSLTCPTLIVDYPRHAFTDGTRAASLIPNARLVVREEVNSPLLSPDVPELIDQIREFVYEYASGATPHSGDAGPRLTDRETEVLAMVATGSTDPEIAIALGIQSSTASRHVHNILAKVGARNRAEAVTWGFMQQVLRE